MFKRTAHTLIGEYTMKKILVFCVALTLLTALLPVTSRARALPGENNGSLVRAGGSGEGKVFPGRSLNAVPQTDGNVKAEVRKGTDVAFRAQQLGLHNKGFAKAYADMINRGGKPLFEEAGVTILATRVGGFDSKKVGFGPAPSVVDGQYEVSFLPFSSGSQSVWEGLIYVSTPEGQAVYAVAHDVTHSDLSQAQLYYVFYYPPDGGPPLEQTSLPNERGGSVRAAAFSNTSASPPPGGFIRFWMCVVGCSFSAYEACLWTGPFFWWCMAAVAALCIALCAGGAFG